MPQDAHTRHSSTAPTVGAVLAAARERFGAVSDSPGLDAQLLLMTVLDVARAHLLAHPEKTLSAEQAAHFSALVERRMAGEPVAYILGRRAFYDREFIVNPAVLIPRPETEHLLEAALDWLTGPAAGRTAPLALDVGTGSGAIAVTLAALQPRVQVYATDISREALEVARLNAAEQGARVTFLQGDLLEPALARGLRIDLLMANLPYIASDVLPGLAVSRSEPRLALDGGPDGLTLIRRLLEQAPGVLQPEALLLLEIGADQGAAALALVREALRPRDSGVIQDYAGLDRVVWASLEA